MLLEGVRATKRILNSKAGTDMNHNAAHMVSERFKSMPTPEQTASVDLFDWIKREMLHLVSDSAYGPNNPFREAEVEKAFWYVTKTKYPWPSLTSRDREFEESTLALCATQFLPDFIRSTFIKGFKGREILVKALDSYLHSNRRQEGSPIVNTHFPLFSASLDESDVARFECANALGSFANTVPTSFWVLYHIFSDPKLLKDVRHQVEAITTTEMSHDGSKTIKRIDLRRLKAATVLFSVVEEVSRYRAVGVGVRVVTEDTVVSEGEQQYLLKKGGWVLIANRALHSDKSVWGDDADQFRADRFCSKIPHLSFRGFGNGASACCGKNFAEYHIAAFMAIMVMRYDLNPVEGIWEEPGQDGRDTASQVAGPMESPKVYMRLRKGPQLVDWNFHV